MHWTDRANCEFDDSSPMVNGTDYEAPWYVAIKLHLAGVSQTLRWTMTIIFISLAIIGIIGSVLLVRLMRCPFYSHSGSFAHLMMAVAVADLTYNLLVIPFACMTELALFQTGRPLVFHLHRCMFVASNVLSLFSDLTSTSMTIERFVSLKKPILWHNRSQRWKKGLSAVMIFTALLMSSFRTFQYFGMAYVLLPDDVNNGTNASSYRIVATAFSRMAVYRAVNAFSTVVMPGAVLVSAVGLNVATVQVLLTRRRRRTVPSWSDGGPPVQAPRTQPGGAASCNPTRLTLMLSASTIVCQLCYIFAYVVYAVGPRRRLLPPTCGQHRVQRSLTEVIAFLTISNAAYVVENLTRASHFYIYLLFNATFRAEVRRLFAKSRTRRRSSLRLCVRLTHQPPVAERRLSRGECRTVVKNNRVHM